MAFSRRLLVFLLLTWALVALYPDPTVLVRSARTIVSPRADAAAAADLAARMPDDPRAIEAAVLRRIPYATDWEVAGVPWRFPTAAQAIADGRGDCEARAMVLMSVLAAKGIPHELRSSLSHMWVDYPGKLPTALENDALVLADRGGGGLELSLPDDFDLLREVESKIALFWDPMPWARRVLLPAGLVLIAAGANLAVAAGAPGAAGAASGRPLPTARSVRPRRRHGLGRAPAGV